MRDRYEVTATNSIVAVGRDNVVSGAVVPSAAATLCAQLDRVRHKLADLTPTEAGTVAAVRLNDLREVVDTRPSDGPEIRRHWERLRNALTAVTALGITGAAAFSADIAQIATTIAGAW